MTITKVPPSQALVLEVNVMVFSHMEVLAVYLCSWESGMLMAPRRITMIVKMMRLRRRWNRGVRPVVPALALEAMSTNICPLECLSRLEEDDVHDGGTIFSRILMLYCKLIFYMYSFTFYQFIYHFPRNSVISFHQYLYSPTDLALCCNMCQMCPFTVDIS